MKILHVLNHSVPHTDGYCVRSSNIVRFQRTMGWDPVVVTSARHEPETTGPCEEIDGIRYHRSTKSDAGRMPVVKEFRSVRQMARTIAHVAESEQVDLIHAHSPCLWGRSAQLAAKRMLLPFVYEVRGVWEEGLIDQGRCTRRSPKYQISRQLETMVARGAAALVTISDALREEFTSRGVAASKIFVIPNGVDTSKFPAMPRNEAVAKSLGLNGKLCISYIGSLYPWEGIDCLIKAMPIVHQALPDARLVIVGKGEESHRLQSLVEQLDCREYVKLVGHVPHNEVSNYYSVSDILVYPRRRSRQTELVTPLKPLEALCMGKCVVASDVGGIRELLGKAGSFFQPDVPSDLARLCVRLGNDRSEVSRLASAGRQLALQTRDWKSVLLGYETVYEAVMRNDNHKQSKKRRMA